MRNIKYGFCALMIMFTACASLPPEVPHGENSSIIGISVRVNRIMFSPNPHAVYFIKLNEKDNIYMSDGSFLKSNFHEGDQYYFLNAEPGRYIAVAAFKGSETTDGRGNTVKESPDDTVYYFPLDMVQFTDTKFKTGEIAFLGKYTLDLPVNFEYGLKNPDESQVYYCKRLQPNKAEPSALGCCIETLIAIGGGTGETAEAVKLKMKDKNRKAETEFWTKAKKHFSESSIQGVQDKEESDKIKIWLNIIDRRLKKISEDQ